jgi:hypothetical protein
MGKMQAGSVQLQAWCVRRFKTRGEAAEFLGLDLSLLGKFINGTRRPKLELAVTLRNLTGIPVEAWTFQPTRRMVEAQGRRPATPRTRRDRVPSEGQIDPAPSDEGPPARSSAGRQAGRDEAGVASGIGGKTEDEGGQAA